MNRVEILNTAAELISGDRAATYGDATVSHQRIADLWATYLGTPVSAVDVAMCMVLLKVSRSKGGDKPGKMDTFVDIAGYAALCAEFEAATIPATTAIREANGSHVGLNSATLAATMRFNPDEE